MKKIKNNLRKLISSLLILTLTICTFAGCTADTKSDTSEKSTDTDNNQEKSENVEDEKKLTYNDESYTRKENGYPNLEGVTLKIWLPISGDYADKIDTYSEMEIVKKFSSDLNVNLEFVHPAQGQNQEHFSIMIAGDTLPDMIFGNGIDNYYPGGITMAYDDGLLFDYSELINEDNTPLFIETVLGNKYMSKGAYDDNGKAIRLGAGISGSEESCTTMFGMMMRKDALEEVGLKKPITYDDWYALLTSLKEKGYEYPLIINDGNYWQTRNAFSAGFGLPAIDFGVTEDNKIIYGPNEDNYKEYLEMMNKWYSEGLINPDFMNQEGTQTWSMLADDIGAITTDHLWPYNPNYFLVVEQEFPEKAMIALDFPVLKEGDEIKHMVTNRGFMHYKYISIDTKYPLACTLLLDMLYNKDVEFMMSNGIEDVGYTLNESGYPEIVTLESNTPDSVILGSRIHELETESDSELEYITTSKYHNGVQPECIKTMIKHGYSGTIPKFGIIFTSEESSIISKYQSDITLYREEMVLKFVTGNESLDNFDDYKQKLKDLHLDDVLKVYNDAYNRYLVREVNID